MRKWELVCGPQAGQVQVWKADYFNHPFWENPYVCVYACAHVCMCVCVLACICTNTNAHLHVYK